MVCHPLGNSPLRLQFTTFLEIPQISYPPLFLLLHGFFSFLSSSQLLISNQMIAHELSNISPKLFFPFYIIVLCFYIFEKGAKCRIGDF